MSAEIVNVMMLLRDQIKKMEKYLCIVNYK